MARTVSSRPFLWLAIVLTVGLFVVGGQPGAGDGFPGIRHWIAHIAAYAVIAGAYARGLPRFPALLVGVLVAALGGLHEVLEITSHAHPFEFDDFLVNGAAGFGGSLATRWLTPASVAAASASS